MSTNTLITASAVARDAAIALSNRLVVGNLVSRSTESTFADKVGDTVTVVTPPTVADAQEFAGSASASNVAQGETKIALEKHFYQKADLTSKQLSLELDDFTRTITVPFIGGISASIDKFMLARMAGGFRRNVAGTVANRPSTLAHVMAGHKALDDAFIPQIGRVALTDSTVKVALAQLAQFSSRDYVESNALNAAMGLNGITPDNPMQYVWSNSNGATWILDPHMGAFARGDIAGTVTATGTAGASTIALAALTAETGVIKEGTSFVTAAGATRYTVTADTPIVGNAVAALPVYPALVESPSTSAVTFEGAGFQNMIYLPGAVAGAIVAPAPLLGGQSAIATYNGLTVRVSFDSSVTTLASSVLFDVFVGCKVVQADGGVIVAG